MSAHHPPRSIERHCDAAIIGASAAGLAAAIELGRQLRCVIVVDAATPRHAPAARGYSRLDRQGLPRNELAGAGREEARSYGVEVLAGLASRVTRTDDHFRLELTGGHSIVARRVLAAASIDELPGTLGLQPSAHPSGLGDFVETDASGETAIPGLYAAGMLTDPSQQGLQAAADGGRVGALISSSLDRDDVGAVRPSANQADWDHRYGGDQIWSGNPNGTLVQEIATLAPGRALDVGAGEGGDALWLAERGWKVTASDISPRALDRIRAEAQRRGMPVDCLQADANAVHPFDRDAFDLVSAQYASIPRTPDGRAVRNLLNAVAPGGTLLVVGHDLEPMRAPVDDRAHACPFDPDAYVRVDDFAGVLADCSGWEILVYEKRPRPPGAASSSHHVDDVVLRARRRAG